MPGALSFSSLPKRNLHHAVADQIGLRIISGEIRPGEALPAELRMCEMLGVSRTAVREAIRVLIAKGMLEARPRSGTRVRPPEHWSHLDEDVLQWRFDTTSTDSYLSKLFELRTVFEPAAAAIAAVNAGEAELALIRSAHVGMAEAQSPEEFSKADVAFHRAVYLATRNEFFWPIGQILSQALGRSFALTAPGEHRARAVAEHGMLLDAIASGDPASARRRALALLRHSEDDLARTLGHDPFEQKQVRRKQARR